ncbi:MAG: hypothetical protein UZ21_OP11001000414 [Microgenomates bacterium OLB22]|nr:MAG: hypothetical protein UZ21_OP11001000414 [Microgenomates bacterium OLB22]
MIMNKRILIAGGLIVILIALVAGLFLTTQQQDIRERADEPTAAPQNPFTSPTLPPQQCGGDGGLCEWDAVPGATGYCYRIEKKVGDAFVPFIPKLAKDDCIPTNETKVSFTMESGIPYRCSVKLAGVASICEANSTDQATLTCGQLTPTSPAGTTTPTTGVGTPTSIQASITPSTPSGSASTTPTTATVGGGSGPTTASSQNNANPTAATTTNNQTGSTQLPRAGLLDYSVVIIGLGLLVVAVGFVL